MILVNYFLTYKVDRRFKALDSLINSKTNLNLEAINCSHSTDGKEAHRQENIHEEIPEVPFFSFSEIDYTCYVKYHY